MQTTATTAPSSNPLLTLLDFIASPILLFNAEGQVAFTNQAAKQMSCRPAVLLGSDPNVRGLVRDIATGKIVLHLDMRVDALSDNGVARLQCRCAPRPIAGLVAMAVTELAPEADDTSAPGQPEPSERLSLQQIMELIKSDLTPPIQQVLLQTPPDEHPALADSVRHLNERLERLSDLINVFGDDVLIGDERMLLPELVRSIAQDLAPLTQKKGVSFVIEGDRADLPPVYGSQRLMRRALHECLHNAVQHAREGVHTSESVAVGIGFRAAGQHLLVQIHNIGVLSAAALTHHAAAIFRPSRDSSGTAPKDPEGLRIGLPLTQRILQLHGGRLRIEQDAANELDVMLELPTGAPMRNTQQLDLLQAQIYAEDLSKLMARSRKRSPA
ncbi:MAG: HAMP domain-containing histidine kinase [Hydrogenophaga sp.]|nr:HAMP domain-containing histidine kinase [Hydrogenophaga sp.]